MAGNAEEELSPGELRRWLARLDKKLDDLQVVHPDVYSADQRTAQVAADALGRRLATVEIAVEAKADRDDLADVRALALWAIGLLAAAVLGGIFYAVLAVAH